jgi:mRNA-degrading endonuclease RelE of RelBE toxin-antitoxin system
MYRVFLEGSAQRDREKLFAKLHDRVVASIQKLGRNQRPAGCRRLTGAE